MATATPQPKPEPKKRKERKAYAGFRPPAPSANLLFPAHANMTAVELLAFLPNSVHCADFVYRLITNGGTLHAVCIIVNTQRDLLAEWRLNSCREWIYKAMEKAGYKDWRYKIHDTFHEERKATWDEANLDVAGFMMPGQIGSKEKQAVNISFKNLALDVRRMPQGGDALDLTRMVQYCVQKPKEPWMYPRDYDALLGLLGGAMKIQREHLDREAFKRWAGKTPPWLRNEQLNPLLVAEQAQREKTEKRVDTNETDEIYEGLQSGMNWSATIGRSEWRTATPGARGYSRTATPTSAGPSRAGTPMTKGKPREMPRKKVKIEEEVETMDVEKQEEYTRLAEYVSPPEDAIKPWAEAIQSCDEAIKLAFLREGQADEHDPRSAYAFGGPRSTSPFRFLYRIDQPDPADCSGWAENLRWAFEQHACFRYTYRPDSWNESPEHMERIVEIRREQDWISDELLAVIADEEERERGLEDFATASTAHR